MSRTYLYREGDGNEGNYPRHLITLSDTDCPFAAIAALVENRYIATSGTRRYIRANLQVDGEAEYGVNATVYEGPRGEQPFGAAWLTAELEPLKPEDVDYYYETRSNMAHYIKVRDAVDAPAYKRYRAALQAKA